MKTKTDSSQTVAKVRPAIDPKAREKQMISYAVDLAEKQLREGTASSQVITHYLKLANTNADLEREKLELENELLKAKTEALQAAKKEGETYLEALKAMSRYNGNMDDEDVQ